MIFHKWPEAAVQVNGGQLRIARPLESGGKRSLYAIGCQKWRLPKTFFHSRRLNEVNVVYPHFGDCAQHPAQHLRSRQCQHKIARVPRQGSLIQIHIQPHFALVDVNDLARAAAAV